MEDGRIYQSRATAQTVRVLVCHLKVCLLPIRKLAAHQLFPLLMGPVDSGKVYCEGWELPSLLSPSKGFSQGLGIHGDRMVEIQKGT